MLKRILSFADREDGVRAVVLNGSRVNPEAPIDIFQDYDILFIVKNIDYYIQERNWINQFGELMIMQTPDEMGSSDLEQKRVEFTFLMQFMSGDRIDLTYYSLEKVKNLTHESLSKVLLDKDGLLPNLHASNTDYITSRPTEKEFADCCNEFWWVSTYIAKGLWRKELSYAKAMFDGPVRDMLIRMLKWHVGMEHDFTVDTGKEGKYLQRFLKPECWDQFVETYPDGDYDNIWNGLFIMLDLFRQSAVELADGLHFSYPYNDDKKVSAHLSHVRKLSPAADKMY